MERKRLTLAEVKSRITQLGWRIASEERLPNGTGTQLRLDTGAIVNCFDTGTVNVQGKHKGVTTEALFGALPGDSRRVYVVSGRDRAAREWIEGLLRQWGLEPMAFDGLSLSDTGVSVSGEATADVGGFGIVLATPDDVGRRVGREEEAPRAAQSVVLRLGILLALLGKGRVAVLVRDGMERPSDVEGTVYITYKKNVEEVAGPLAEWMGLHGVSANLTPDLDPPW